MNNEWFDVAYINHDEAILHGQMVVGRDEFGVNQEREIRVSLTLEQRRAIEDLNFAHQQAMNALLRGFAS